MPFLVRQLNHDPTGPVPIAAKAAAAEGGNSLDDFLTVEDDVGPQHIEIAQQALQTTFDKHLLHATSSKRNPELPESTGVLHRVRDLSNGASGPGDGRGLFVCRRGLQ